MLQQSIGTYTGESVIGKGNIISKSFPKKQLLACRSPHITMGNIYLPNNTENHLVTRYINLTDNIVVINSIGENILQRANSMDFDSDQMMIVDNEIMFQSALKNYEKFLVPTTDIEPVTKKDKYTKKNLATLDYNTSENLIGEIVNLSQVLNSKLWHEMNKEEPNQQYIDKLYKDVCQLSIMSGLEIDKAKKTLVVDNKAELDKIRKKYKGKDKKIGYPMFFKELSKKGKYNAKRTYIYYNTTLDMIGKEIASLRMKVENDEKELVSILRKPSIKSRDIDTEAIKSILEICKERQKEDNKLGLEKDKIGKSEFNRRRKQNIENFVDDIEDYKKVNQATLYTLLASEEANKYIDYILQGLLEVKSPTLKKMVKSDEKTPTLIESKDGEIEIYGINHTKTEVG